ncbi:MAG TPA: Plug domain-containing protein, partial [Aquabacterium sp.]|nr:Plug domain-containing protein [Aquabacterium sp.]
MFPHSFALRPLVAAALLAFGAMPLRTPHAQGIATESQLETVVIKSSRQALSPTLPSNTASKTADDLKKQNLVNPEDALEQLPGLTIRKRYAGDRNANVGGRSYGTLQPGRALVYVDGYLISNFLGRFDAPRWNMINTEAVARVDALYGPFSAIYPGNSIGTTVIVTERKPKGFEASVSLKVHDQAFDEYGTHEHYRGRVVST